MATVIYQKYEMQKNVQKQNCFEVLQKVNFSFFDVLYYFVSISESIFSRKFVV